jgi:hypothetical protein
MPPSVFGFLHVVVIAIGVMLVVILKNVVNRGTRRIFRYIALTAAGAISGALASYFLAHIAAPVIQYFNPISTHRIPHGYSFLFWALFVCFSLILIMAGGVTGIMTAGRMENQTESNTENMNLSGNCRPFERYMDEVGEETISQNKQNNG